MARKKRSDLNLIVDNNEAINDHQNGANKKKFHVKDLKHITPITRNQKEAFLAYNSNYNLFLHGSAGTGKTFLSMYLGLRDVLDEGTPYKKLIILRSNVATRDLGFLPGSEQEKMEVFEAPYDNICNDLFPYSKTYENLKKNGYVEFMSTSFLRGITFDNCIILVDEAENCSMHELDSIITRVGNDTKIIFSGDLIQTDLLKSRHDVTGLGDMLNIVRHMEEFSVVEFTVDDIVRSGLVRSYLVTKEKVEDNKL